MFHPLSTIEKKPSFQNVNIVETFLEKGSVLQVSHGPIFSDFVDKSPNCVKQFVSTRNQRNSTNEQRPVLEEGYDQLNYDAYSYSKLNNNKSSKRTKQITSTTPTIQENRCGHRVDRRQRRSRKKQNVSTHQKPCKTSVAKENHKSEVKSANTEFAPFFTLDPRWPDYVIDKKTTVPLNKRPNSSLLSPSSPALVPKAHAKPEVVQSVPSNKDDNTKLLQNDALLKDLQKHITDMKTDINKTNLLVKDVDMRLKSMAENHSRNQSAHCATKQDEAQKTVCWQSDDRISLPCASPMKTTVLPLPQSTDVLSLIPEPWIPQFSKTRTFSSWNESYTCNPTVVPYSHGTETAKKYDKGTVISEALDTSISTGSTAKPSKQQTQNDQNKEILMESLSSAKIPLETALSLPGSDTVLNMDKLVKAKRKDLRNLSLKKGLCAIELEFMTKLNKAKRQFIKDFEARPQLSMKDAKFTNARGKKSAVKTLNSAEPKAAQSAVPNKHDNTKLLENDGLLKEVQKGFKELEDNIPVIEPLHEETPADAVEVVTSSLSETTAEVLKQSEIKQNFVERQKEDVAPRTPSDDNEPLRITEQTEPTSIPMESPSKTALPLNNESISLQNTTELQLMEPSSLTDQVAENDHEGCEAENSREGCIDSNSSKSEELFLHVEDLSSSPSTVDELQTALPAELDLEDQNFEQSIDEEDAAGIVSLQPQEDSLNRDNITAAQQDCNETKSSENQPTFTDNHQVPAVLCSESKPNSSIQTALINDTIQPSGQLEQEVQDRSAEEAPKEVREKSPASDSEMENKFPAMEGALVYVGSSSASSVVSETGIDLCTSDSSSAEVFIEAKDSEPATAGVLQPTMVANASEEIEVDKKVLEADQPMKHSPAMLAPESMHNFQTDTEQQDQLVVKGNSPDILSNPRDSANEQGIEHLVESSLEQFIHSGEMESFFKESAVSAGCFALPLRLPASSNENTISDADDVTQMSVDQMNLFLIAARRKIHSASKVTSTLTLPSAEELKREVKEAVNELIEWKTSHASNSAWTQEELDSFFGDDYRFHELLVRHLKSH